MAVIGLSDAWVTVYGLLGLASLIPVVWAVVDFVRRPKWQISTARKVWWVISFALTWFLLWPIALGSACFYLFVLRKRLPSPAAQLPMATWDPYATVAGGRPPPLPTPGWFPDPSGQADERWWDGRGWSDRTRSSAGPPS
jgi:hypothetical protein